MCRFSNEETTHLFSGRDKRSMTLRICANCDQPTVDAVRAVVLEWHGGVFVNAAAWICSACAEKSED
jgi:hypothetical protein